MQGLGSLEKKGSNGLRPGGKAGGCWALGPCSSGDRRLWAQMARGWLTGTHVTSCQDSAAGTDREPPPRPHSLPSGRQHVPRNHRPLALLQETPPTASHGAPLFVCPVFGQNATEGHVTVQRTLELCASTCMWAKLYMHFLCLTISLAVSFRWLALLCKHSTQHI